MAKSPQTTAAKAATPKPAEATGGAPTAAAATQAETAAQQDEKAEQARQAEADAAEEAKGLAEDQQADVKAGGTGELTDEARTLAKRHSVSDPKAAPVDYAVQTARKPAHRLVDPEETSAEAMPRAPIAALPYGSEPRAFDPATGMAPVPEAKAPEDVHGADLDPDTDRGSSAALREAAAAS